MTKNTTVTPDSAAAELQGSLQDDPRPAAALLNPHARRHSEGAIYAFSDGHSKWFKRGKNVNGDAVGANATVNGVRYYYFWRNGVTGK
jgi:prepilin-type processing-associated H-X9-DG protein